MLAPCQGHGLDTAFAADLNGRGVSIGAARGEVPDLLAVGDTRQAIMCA